MKKIKIFTAYLLFSIYFLAVLYAQEAKTTMELLTQHEWRTNLNVNEDLKMTISMSFTPTHLIQKTEISGTGDIENGFKYYLSENKETTFDDSKVGKVSNGHYIIMVNKFSIIDIWEITKISESEFEFSPVIIKESQVVETRSAKIRPTFKCQPKLE